MGCDFGGGIVGLSEGSSARSKAGVPGTLDSFASFNMQAGACLFLSSAVALQCHIRWISVPTGAASKAASAMLQFSGGGHCPPLLLTSAAKHNMHLG